MKKLSLRSSRHVDEKGNFRRLHSRDYAVTMLHRNHFQLCRTACAEGWQTHLLDFFQGRGQAPNGFEQQMLSDRVAFVDELLAGIEGGRLGLAVSKIMKHRESVKTELLGSNQEAAE